ncbi:hypothetical protein [Neoroseomonas lacus]|uniref:hypothetical protein n=1 Tax=Neoroseomonas lacus TaxID=287609 RepID=UPI001E58B9AD|nr:hypothetical protein [Neoroseomonas lacus]
MRAAAAILAGAALLLWPAVLNGYPLVFSDTGGFLHQTLGPLMLWDKPWIYGPLLHLTHWRVSLWLPMVAQGLVVSHLLWLVQRALGGAAAGRHLAVCLVAALLTGAPFTGAMLMPDVFAPVVVLALFLLGPGRGSLGAGERGWVVALASVGIAAHLSHLPLAAAMVALALLAGLPRRRGIVDAAWVAVPVVAAVVLLLVTNLVGHGRLALSPHGATFMLARLQADGPATEVIRDRCPDAGWYLCAFVDRLPMDANDFLWRPDSPVNRDAAGQPRFLGGALISAEAGKIVSETLRAHPVAVMEAVLSNTLRQMVTVGVGDTLGAENLATALRPRIAEGFPPRELAAFDAGMQARGVLAAVVAPLNALDAGVLLLALPLLAWGGWRAWQAGDVVALAYLGAILLGVVVNAAATGGLSGVFPRYQARIAWLLPVAAMLLLSRRRA